MLPFAPRGGRRADASAATAGNAIKLRNIAETKVLIGADPQRRCCRHANGTSLLTASLPRKHEVTSFRTLLSPYPAALLPERHIHAQPVRVTRICRTLQREGAQQSLDTARSHVLLRRLISLTAVASVGLVCPGCAVLSVVSRDGPPTGEVVNNAEVVLPDPGYRLSYALVSLSPQSLDFFAAVPQRFAAFSRTTASAGPAEVRIGPGDTVGVTIFEAAGGGLSCPRGAAPGMSRSPPNRSTALAR